MTCPLCLKEIDFVWVYSNCRQAGVLGRGRRSKTIDEYADTEVMSEILSLNCPECGGELSGYVRE